MIVARHRFASLMNAASNADGGGGASSGAGASGAGGAQGGANTADQGKGKDAAAGAAAGNGGADATLQAQLKKLQDDYAAAQKRIADFDAKEADAKKKADADKAKAGEFEPLYKEALGKVQALEPQAAEAKTLKDALNARIEARSKELPKHAQLALSAMADPVKKLEYLDELEAERAASTTTQGDTKKQQGTKAAAGGAPPANKTQLPDFKLMTQAQIDAWERENPDALADLGKRSATVDVRASIFGVPQQGKG